MFTSISLLTRSVVHFLTNSIRLLWSLIPIRIYGLLGRNKKTRLEIAVSEINNHHFYLNAVEEGRAILFLYLNEVLLLQVLPFCYEIDHTLQQHLL